MVLEHTVINAALRGRHIADPARRAIDDNIDVVQRDRKRAIRIGGEVLAFASAGSAREVELVIDPWRAHRRDRGRLFQSEPMFARGVFMPLRSRTEPVREINSVRAGGTRAGDPVSRSHSQFRSGSDQL